MDVSRGTRSSRQSEQPTAQNKCTDILPVPGTRDDLHFFWGSCVQDRAWRPTVKSRSPCHLPADKAGLLISCSRLESVPSQMGTAKFGLLHLKVSGPLGILTACTAKKHLLTTTTTTGRCVCSPFFVHGTHEEGTRGRVQSVHMSLAGHQRCRSHHSCQCCRLNHGLLCHSRDRLPRSNCFLLVLVVAGKATRAL